MNAKYNNSCWEVLRLCHFLLGIVSNYILSWDFHAIYLEKYLHAILYFNNEMIIKKKKKKKKKKK